MGNFQTVLHISQDLLMGITLKFLHYIESATEDLIVGCTKMPFSSTNIPKG